MEVKNKCPKCGREYSCPPAISRLDNHTAICPVCGIAEAITPPPRLIGQARSGLDTGEILSIAEEAEVRYGRVKPL